MTIKEIIDGLKFTVEMFLFDPMTGETFNEPRNDMDKTTIDACKGAIELLEQTKWISVSERLPKAGEYVDDVARYYLVQNEFGDMMVARYHSEYWEQMYQLKPISDEIVAWMPLPQPYVPDINIGKMAESEDKE